MSNLPEWVKKATVKSGPCKVCGPNCNDANLLFEALCIAWEALEWHTRGQINLRALLARLEAAEALIRHEQGPRNDMKWLKLLTTWCKAAGK